LIVQFEMAAKMADQNAKKPVPTRIVVHQQSCYLELEFAGAGIRAFKLAIELLRVFSPSAEVKGHGTGQAVLQVGKQGVTIREIIPVGNYAIQPVFSDGHSTGIFSWDYLHWLNINQESIWEEYLSRLAEVGASRDPNDPNNARFQGGVAKSCGRP
jgi:DUF971 family protein